MMSNYCRRDVPSATLAGKRGRILGSKALLKIRCGKYAQK